MGFLESVSLDDQRKLMAIFHNWAPFIQSLHLASLQPSVKQKGIINLNNDEWICECFANQATHGQNLREENSNWTNKSIGDERKYAAFNIEECTDN